MREKSKRFTIYGVKEVHSLDEWSKLTPNHINQKRSSYLMGKSWLEAGEAFPTSVAAALQKSTIDSTELLLRFAVAERLTVLDTLRAPSRTDMMVYCCLRKTEKAVFAVEGKATEPFDDEILRWIRDAPRTCRDPLSLPIKRGRKARLDFLNRLLGLNVGTDSALHYQLLHRTACALLEAKSICASTAFMLVQSFCKCPENWDAYVAFAKEMGFGQIEEDSFTEAKQRPAFPDIDLRLGWIYDTAN